MATTNKKVKKGSKAASLTSQNKKEVIAKVTEKKDLKYIYPESAEKGKTKGDILQARKNFRRQTRAKLSQLVKGIKNAKKSGDAKELHDAEKELRMFKKSVLVNAA